MRRRSFLKLAWGSVAVLAAPPYVHGTGISRIAVVHSVAPTTEMNEQSNHPLFKEFFSELRKLGYVEGGNLRVERRSGGGRPDLYAEIANELAALKPDMIFVSGARPLAYLRGATQSIPIVAITGDPILFKIVSNVSRPEANVTGFSADASIEIHGKYLEILKELNPGLTKVGLLTPQLSWDPYFAPLGAIAGQLGLEIIGPPVDNPSDEAAYRRAITAMVQQGAGGLLVTQASENVAFRSLIVDMASQKRLIAIYPNREFVKLGGLVAYAVNLQEIAKRAADYSDKLLRGAKIADLPYVMPTKLRLILNLKSATALGLNVPPGLLARADEIID